MALDQAIGRRSNVRWVICGLLFFATTINYVDRSVLGVLKPTISKDLHWSESDYADVVAWFQLFYAIGYAVSGRLIDRIGIRVGFTIAVAVWSIAASITAFAHSALQFRMVRGLLGLAEGGNFPGATKTTAGWFPRKDRSLAFGVLNAGSNIGALLTPLIVPWVTLSYGWSAAFLVTGSFGGLWLVGWLVLYRSPESHPRVTPEELAYIKQDPPAPQSKVSWAGLLRYRATWAAIFGIGLSAPIWWFYINWIPDLLGKQYHLDLKNVGPPLIAMYLFADVGSVGGGAASTWLMKLGWALGRARKTALFMCLVAILPIMLVPQTMNVVVATVLVGLAMAAHQGWSANVYTMVSDTMPIQNVSSVVGLAGMVGSLIGIVYAKFVGWMLDSTHSYGLVLALVPAGYLIAYAAISILLPKYEMTAMAKHKAA